MPPRPRPPAPPVVTTPRPSDFSAYGATPASARAQIEALGPVLPNLAPQNGDTLVWSSTRSLWEAAPGGGGGLSSVETLITRSMSFNTVVGESYYRLPVGNWFRAAAGVTTLFINGIEMFFGADYIFITRHSQPTTVSDCAFGFQLMGQPASIMPMVFTWVEGVSFLQPPSIALQRLIDNGSGYEPNFTVGEAWLSSSATQTANGVEIAEPPAPYVVEFWRETRNRGGLFNTPLGGKRYRHGRRYMPYFRGPSNLSLNRATTFHYSEFSALVARPWQKFRVCYYNPTTGARSPLSSETLIVCPNGGSMGERIPGVPAPGIAHQPGAVWIKR